MDTIYVAVIKDSANNVLSSLSFKADGEAIDLVRQYSEEDFLKWVNNYKSENKVEIFYYEDVVKFAQELYKDFGDYSLAVLCKVLKINENRDELYTLVSVILKLWYIKNIRKR